MAAEQLNLTQPAISRSVSALEDELCLRIFERGRNGARLTRAGEAVLRDARRIIDDARKTREKFQHWSTGDLGCANFGCGSAAAEQVLGEVLTAASRLKPKLEINCFVRTPEQLHSELERGNVEFYVCTNIRAPDPDQHLLEHLTQQKFGFFVRSDHSLAGMTVTREQLKDFPVAVAASRMSLPLHPDNPLSRHKVDELAFDEGVFTHDFQPTIRCEATSVLQQLALGSDVVLFTSPGPSLRAELEARQLCQLEVQGISFPDHTISLVRPRDRLLTPACEVIIDLFKRYCQM